MEYSVYAIARVSKKYIYVGLSSDVERRFGEQFRKEGSFL
ncbi:MAG: GIY-YIG nuclease family protein [Saprospiraceae bacterium]